jgi:hypothetical protein
MAWISARKTLAYNEAMSVGGGNVGWRVAIDQLSDKTSVSCALCTQPRQERDGMKRIY